MSITRRSDRITNVVVLGVAAVAVIANSRGLWGRIAQWSEEKATQRYIESQWTDISAGDRLGDAIAAPGLVAFADYQCPFCKQAHDILDSLLVNHPGTQIVYRHYPLTALHPFAEAAARAAICASTSGVFARFHALLYAIDDWTTEPEWLSLASDAGIEDGPEFRKCMDAPATRARLASDMEIANQIHVEGTPTFVSRTHGIVYGLPTPEGLADLLLPGRIAGGGQ